jgi:hypothetical protein
MNVLFYGNCQMVGIKEILNLDRTLYNPIAIECFNTNVTREEMTRCIKNADIIITQPIQDNYRGKDYLSTTYIIYHSKKTCKIILLNSCFFDFYHFDTKSINKDYVITPYHNISLYECYKSNKTIEHYIFHFVKNKHLKTKEELETIVTDNLKELERRYNLMLLHKQYSPEKNIYSFLIADYIKNNYKDKLLFYTPNHPSKFLLQYICENIVDILNIPNYINYTIDPFVHTKCILNKCIESVVHFNVDEYPALIDGKSTLNEICQLYYNIYDNNTMEI